MTALSPHPIIAYISTPSITALLPALLYYYLITVTLRNFFKAVASTAKVMQSVPIVYTAAKLQIGRLRMWTEGFESEGFSLKEILEEDHELAGAVLRLITEFSVHVLTELGYS